MKYKLVAFIIIFALFIQAQGAQSEAKTKEYKDLVGRWMRPDGGYVLAIKDVKKNGDINADYLNPRSIHVSKAKMSTDEGQINIFVELQDRGYPGSYYTLTYDPINDRLVGVYHHLGINQNFDVFFVRE